MPSNSPYAKSFQSATKRGTSCWTAVSNIAKRNNTNTTTVFNSLFKAGLVNRQKFNGQWLYWPAFDCKTSASSWKDSQIQMWQCFIDFCVCHGWCNPQQMTKFTGSQKDFMASFKKFWSKQFTSTSSSTPKKSSMPKRTSVKKSMKTRSYKFPTTTTRRRKAA